MSSVQNIFIRIATLKFSAQPNVTRQVVFQRRVVGTVLLMDPVINLVIQTLIQHVQEFTVEKDIGHSS